MTIMAQILVDNKKIEAEEGSNLLKTCLENDIYIPNLCYLEEMDAPFAACRLCFVEIDGKPAPACTREVTDGLCVTTDAPEIRRLQKAAFRLLLSTHEVKCKQCPANKKCELQKIARFLKVGLKAKGLETKLKDTVEDISHPYLQVDRNRCVLCGKCVNICRLKHGNAYLTFARRGFETVIDAYLEPEEAPLKFSGCTACVDICPVRAISLKESA